MSGEQPSPSASKLSDSFVKQVDASETKRALAAESRRADKAEASLAQFQRSKWWRVSGPIRRRLHDRRVAKRNATGMLAVGEARRPQTQVPEAISLREAALAGRLQTVLDLYEVTDLAQAPFDELLVGYASFLDARSNDKPLAWLTFIAVVGRYPNSEEMVVLWTDLAVNGAAAAIDDLLRANSEQPPSSAVNSEIVITRAVVADTTTTAWRTGHTGIPRVVRELVPRWVATHGVELMVWGKANVFRAPRQTERWRVLEFEPGRASISSPDEKPTNEPILVPWNTTVVVPENTMQRGRAEALAAIGEWSGSTLSAIAYDFIWYTLPETQPDELRMNLANSVVTIRSAARVSAISDSVNRDVHAFGEMAANIGLSVPRSVAHRLPIEADEVADAQFAAALQRDEGVPGLPVILSVSSIEPRKNHIMFLRAAEKLWKQGLQFQVVIIGWGSWRAEPFIRELERLQARGRPVRVIRKADEAVLWAAYRSARFSVYISLAEGFGLPAAESIACGTPVVLSNVGSMAEIGADGGALLVNPRDLDEVANAMRTLLTDDDELALLKQEALAYPSKTWDQYASQTWDWLVSGTA